MGMTWDQLARTLAATPDDSGWLHVTRQLGGRARHYLIQRVTIGEWELALVQTTIAHEIQLGGAEAATRLSPFPFGALVFGDGFWALRQALDLEGLTLERFELALRCLAYVARELVPARPAGATTDLFAHYAD
jgi:hypothetical protein